MNAGPAREMTLEEYVGRLPSGHLARRELATVKAENERLKAWKDSVMELESSWDIQAVAKALGIQLGLPIHPGILPGIEKLKNENDLMVACYREMLGLEEGQDIMVCGHHKDSVVLCVDDGTCYCDECEKEGRESEIVEVHPNDGKIPRQEYESKLPNICDDCGSGPDCTDSGCPHRDED